MKEDVRASKTLGEIPHAHYKGLLEEEDIVEHSTSHIDVREERVCGVYFLIRDGKIVYVGQSIDIHRRVIQHKNSAKDFDSFSILVINSYYDRIRQGVEAKYIRKFDTEYNG